MELKIKYTQILGIVFILTAIIGFTPLLYRSGIILLLIELLSLMVVVQNSHYSVFRSNIPLVANVFFYLLIVFSYRALGISDISWGSTISHSLFFIPILLLPFVSLFSPKKSEWLILIMVTVVVVVICDNIRLCLMHPEILLEVNRDFMVSEIEGVGNIGGSGWYNSITFFFVTCFFCFLNCENKKIKYAMLVSSVISGVFVIAFCLKASVIVFTILSAVLLVFAKKTKSLSRFICIGTFISLFAYLFVALFADVITDFLISTAEKRLASRMMVFVDPESMEASSGVGTMNARGRLWMVSVNTWLSNPINFLFGIGDHHALSAHDIIKNGIGNHSDLFDSFGRYGLIGVFFIFNILRLGCKYIVSLFENEKKLQIIVVFFILIVYGFTKGIFKYAIGCSIFLILPLLSNIKMKEDKNIKS